MYFNKLGGAGTVKLPVWPLFQLHINYLHTVKGG